MEKTPLPDKKKWGRDIRAWMQATKITQDDIISVIEISRPTLIKVLDGKGTHDQLSTVEGAIISIMRGL